MDKLILCTFLCISFSWSFVSTQSHGNGFTDSAPLATRKETAEPMLKFISELAKLFIDIEEAFNKRSPPIADFEEYPAEEIDENHRQSSGYFNRISENSRNFQERIGSAVTERPSDLPASSYVVGLNIQSNGRESSVDISEPLPMSTSLEPELRPVNEEFKDETSVSSSMDETSTKPEANSESADSEGIFQVTDTDINEQEDDKIMDQDQELLVENSSVEDDLDERIEKLSQLYERLKEIRESLIHMKSIGMSQNLQDGSEITTSEKTENEPQDISDDLNSESEMDRPTEKFLRRSASNLVNPYADIRRVIYEKNLKLLHNGAKEVEDARIFKKKFRKTNPQSLFESYNLIEDENPKENEKRSFVPKLIYYPVYKRQDDVSSEGYEDADVKKTSEDILKLKASSNKDFLLMLEPLNPLTFRAPLSLQKSTAEPLLAFHHRSGSVELPETSDKPEIKLLLPAFFYPDKSTEVRKTDDELDIVVAFTSNGMPLKLGISTDIKNPITFLNGILHESDVTLNVPIELHKDGEAELVGEDVLKVGLSDGTVIVRPRYFDLSNSDDLEDLLTTLREIKISQSSRNKQTGE